LYKNLKMKKISILIIIVISIIGTKGYSQINIVDHGNFEAAKTDNCSIGGDGYCPWQPYQDQKDYWSNFYGWTYPKNLPTLGPVGSPDILCEEKTIVFARSGKRVGHTINREFLINKMNNKTQNNIIYYVEFYIKAVTPFIENSGLKFFINQPWQDGLGPLKKSYGNASGWNTIDVNIPHDVEFNKDNWRKVSRYFITNNNYEYFAFGSFIDEDKTQRLWVDDISVIALNSTACPPYWKFQHTEFNSNMLFQASDYITLGENHDNTQPVGPVYFRAGSKTILKAANTINITPGIVYEPGSFVHMAIEPCGNSPCPAPIVNNSAITICNSSPVLFTQPSETGVFYSWSPTDYLDNPNSASPTFTPPNNFIGTIIYTVTATNICGQQQTAQVKVFADANPEPNPWFSIVNPSTPPYYDAYNFTVEVGMSSHTEWIKFELLKKGTNIVLNGKIYYRDVDFTCCNFNWSTTSFLPSIYNCNDYDIRITTKNYCYNNTYSQVYAWNKTTYPFNLIKFPDVFSPPNPPNGALYIAATGVVLYDIIVRDRWGKLVFIKIENVNSSPFLVWDGKCNIGPNSGNYVLDDGYEVMLKLFGCNGLVYDGGQVVKVINDNVRIGVFEDSAKIDIAKSSVPYSLFPNPSNGNVEVLFFGDTLNEKQLSIFDFTGKLVFDIRLIENYNTIDLSNLSNGIYIVVLNDGENNYKEKLVIAK